MGWMVGQNGDTSTLSFVTFGAIFFTAWHLISFRAGHTLQAEFFNGTIDMMILSPTPLAIIVMGRVLGIVAVASVSIPISFFVFTTMAGGLPQVSNIFVISVSMLLVSGSLIIVSYFFSPLYVLSGGGRGYVNAVAPLGVVFSGFLYPIDVLPIYFKPIAWVIPTSWAMESVALANLGMGLSPVVLQHWFIAGTLSLIWLAATVWMFKKVENRVRDSGILGRY